MGNIHAFIDLANEMEIRIKDVSIYDHFRVVSLIKVDKIYRVFDLSMFLCHKQKKDFFRLES